MGRMRVHPRPHTHVVDASVLLHRSRALAVTVMLIASTMAAVFHSSLRRPAHGVLALHIFYAFYENAG